MKTARYLVSLISGGLTLAGLIWLTVQSPPNATRLGSIGLFSLLIIFTLTFGVPLAGGSVSLMPMAAVAACLSLGLIPAAWAALTSAIIHGWIRFRWGAKLGEPSEQLGIRLVVVTAANVTMHTLSILGGGLVFQWLGKTLPLTDALPLIPLLLLCLTYLGINYVIAGLHIALRGRAPFLSYIRFLPGLIWYEGAPLVFAPLTAMIYIRLGDAYLVLFALALAVSSLIARNLAATSRRLSQRIKELAGLQAVGQALSASLRIETVVEAIYEQVSRLMPAPNFYVALYDAGLDEVSFALSIETGQRVQWRPRRAGNGLTEYVLRTRQPLLIPQDVQGFIEKLGITPLGRPSTCWLGVPIVAGDRPLGVITLQSYSGQEQYTQSDVDVLYTIAAQAAVAIQNARLYAQTDETLARRVQELDSILRTVSEGVLLLDLNGHILAVNRTLAEWLGISQSELSQCSLNDLDIKGSPALIVQIGYTCQDFEIDCQSLIQGDALQRQARITLEMTRHHVERTLTPVRDVSRRINGWLLVFRDVTQEVELDRLRQDTMHMLVHDLRSPLTVILSSLDLMKRAFEKQDLGRFERLLQILRDGGMRMLNMVNQLLDISKLESGQFVIHPQAVEADKLLQETQERLAPIAAQAQISITVSVAPHLPPLLADPDVIGRVLNNLVDNAIKFTPDGGRIELEADYSETTPNDLTIQVSDTGPGIPAEALPRLFEKFHQVESVQGRRQGTGLGLSFCKLAVEAHKGTIRVKSQMGQGSIFIISLPSYRPSPASVD